MNFSNWTLVNVNADGNDFIYSDSSFELTGGNNQSGTAGITNLMGFTPSFTEVTFRWCYQTDDSSAQWDPFNFLNGSMIDTVVNSGNSQCGNYSAEVQSGNYGFQVVTTDNMFGAATVTISNLSAVTVPWSLEPGLLVAGVVLFTLSHYINSALRGLLNRRRAGGHFF